MFSCKNILSVVVILSVIYDHGNALDSAIKAANEFCKKQYADQENVSGHINAYDKCQVTCRKLVQTPDIFTGDVNVEHILGVHLQLPSGTACGNEMQCQGKTCAPNSLVEQCKHALNGDEINSIVLAKDVSSTSCINLCNSVTKEASINQPDGSPCGIIGTRKCQDGLCLSR